MAPQVRTMIDRLVVELQHHVLRRHHVNEARTDLHVCRQHEDAVVILREPEFLLAADHPVRFDAADLGRLDLERPLTARVGQGVTRLNDHNFLAALDVGRAAHDLLDAPWGQRNTADAQLVGIGVTLLVQHLPHDQRLEAVTERVDAVDLRRTHREVGEDALRLEVGEVDVARQPAEGELHGEPGPYFETVGNWRRNRRSPPMNKRMSSMP